MSDSDSLTARLKRELLLMKAKAEALAFSVSEKDAEIELLHDRQERQHTQVCSGVASAHYKLYTGKYEVLVSSLWPGTILEHLYINPGASCIHFLSGSFRPLLDAV